MELREKLIALSVLKNGNWFKMYDVLKDDELTDFTKLYLVNDFDKVLSLGLIEEEKEVSSEIEEMINKKIEEIRNQH